jgi:hypothetical protein
MAAIDQEFEVGGAAGQPRHIGDRPEAARHNRYDRAFSDGSSTGTLSRRDRTASSQRHPSTVSICPQL